MRIEIASHLNHPVPQFVVHAENASDRAVLKSFINYPQQAKSPVRFWLHGSTYSCDVSGVVSFNFGYIFESADRKPSLMQKLKAALRW